ncbi:MAG: hypothetical protein AAGA53_17845 [Pseudomonadota bacterium]
MIAKLPHERIAVTLSICVPLIALQLSLPESESLKALPRAVFVEIPEGNPVPKLSATSFKDSRGDWSIQINATHFQFTEICNAFATQANIGHAHVHLNGEKIGTAFTPIFPLGTLKPGVHKIYVTLQAQDHRTIASRDGVVSTEFDLVIPEHQTHKDQLRLKAF